MGSNRHLNPAALAAAIRFADYSEVASPDEEQVIRQLAEVNKTIVKKVFDDSGHAERAVHAKSHALLNGELKVFPDLPAELKQGVFSIPREYQAVVRISSIAGDLLSDSVSLPRGFSIKLYDVAGERLPGSEDTRTQDFLMVSGTVFATGDMKAFLRDLKLLAATTDRAAWAKSALSTVLRPVTRAFVKAGIATGNLPSFGGFPESNPLGERFGTQAAQRFGDYMAKLDLVPGSDNFKALTGHEFELRGRENAVRDEIASVLRKEGGAWILRAQLCRNLAANPVDDPSIEWPEDSNPYLPIARLEVKAQEGWSMERSRRVDDEMSFSPWHGIVAHQPLGVIGRVRKYVYPTLMAYRGALNGCPIHELAEPPDLAAP
ncbi:MAG TPA: catalase family protein [Steroidobacteraceae bacterium]